MKKLLIICLTLSTTLVFCQDETEKFLIEKGTWNLETDLSLSFSDFENSNGPNLANNNRNGDSFGFDISPKAGYFINDNLVLGLGLGYGYNKTETEDNSRQDFPLISESNSISFFPYVKKFFPIGNKFSLHLQGEARFSNFKNESKRDDSLTESESRVFLIGIRPGLSFKISDNFLIQSHIGLLSFQNRNTETDNSDDGNTLEYNSSTFGLNLTSSNISLGISILL